jgi:hypothetical protein
MNLMPKLGRRQFVGYLSSVGLMSTVGVEAGFMWACNSTPPTWIQTALADLPEIASIAATVAQIIVDALGGSVISAAVAAAINTAANAIEVAVPIIESLITSYQANPSAPILTKIQVALQELQTNFTAILTAAHISNVALVATITGVVDVALTVVNYLIKNLPVLATEAAARATSGTAATQTLTSAQMVAQATQILNQNGYGSYAHLLTVAPAQ